MKKIVASALLLLVSSLQAGEVVKEKSVKGFYAGLGYGISTFNGSYYSGTYTDVGGSIIYDRQTKSVYSDNSAYKIYGGYQYDKILGIELAYNDYGRFENSIEIDKVKETYTQNPSSITLSANLGYYFLANQLRPFGIIGMSYMQTNQNIPLFNKEDLAAHWGGGVEYYPRAFKGVGFRAALELDSVVIGQQTYSSDQDKYKESILFRDYASYYFAISYKY